ncbi:MAG TPA: cytochrome c [Candidatus Angelobacter sp.]|nr:cytochrome c [Candidatus Angelobacter sp.]
MALAAVLFTAGCRQDMHNQPKFIPLRSNSFYPDQRSARFPIAGTVPRLENPIVDAEQLDPESYFLTGKHGNTFGNELPPSLLENANLHDVLKRGQERYNIYCTPCHAYVGDGNGMVVQRGFKHPPSFHEQRLRNAPLGYIYQIMSNGFGAMPDYAAQVHPADRWAIAAYIRVLQRSQHAESSDVPDADKAKLDLPADKQPRLEIPPNSFASPTTVRPQRRVEQ